MNDQVMNPNPRFAHPASRERLTKVAEALEKNNIAAFVVPSREAARAKVHELVPKGAEVFTATSRTLDELGIAARIERGRPPQRRTAEALEDGSQHPASRDARTWRSPRIRGRERLTR